MVNPFGFLSRFPTARCGQYTPGLVLYHNICDLLIAAAYLTYPLLILRLLPAFSRKAIPALVTLAVFIVACGLTHLFQVLSGYYPLLHTSAHIKLLTAVVSIVAVIILSAIDRDSLRRVADYLSHDAFSALRDEQMVRILDIHSTPTLTIDPGGTIQYANAAMTQLVGVGPGELVGKDVRGYIPGDIDRIHSVPELKTKAGASIPVKVVASPLPDGGPAATVITVTDVSHRIRDLAHLNRMLTQANEELESYTHLASHDLRAPLRVLKTYAEKLIRLLPPDVSSRDEIRSAIGRITAAAKQADDLALGLLQYSTLGESVDRAASASLARELATITQFNDPESVDIAVTGNPVIELAIKPMHLHEVLANLVGNSVKYQPPGQRPQIAIQVDRLDSDCIISVSDNGIGIDPEHYQDLYKPFRRFQPSTKYEGTGLGLATVHKLLSSYGGKIQIDTTFGPPGVKFTLTIPVATSP